MKKFELTTDTKMVFGKKLFRIKALINFGNVEVGELGGYIEEEENLSHDNNAWVYDNAMVYGNAVVCGNAKVCGDAMVYGNAKVCDNAMVCGNAKVCGDAMVCGNADYTTIKGFGTECRTTTFFRCEDKTIKVSCGCFLGTIDEFRAQVIKTRKGKVAEEYLAIADLMEKHFKEE